MLVNKAGWDYSEGKWHITAPVHLIKISPVLQDGLVFTVHQEQALASAIQIGALALSLQC